MGSLAAAVAVALAGVAIPSTAAPPPVRPDDIHVVTVEADAEARMTVPVRIGDHGTFRFLVDTGSQRTVLASELAARLALAPGERLRITGIAGSDMVDTAKVEEIQLGTRALADLLLPLLHAEHIGADGIVGVDSLQGQRVLIDFERNTMAVGAARDLGGDSGYDIVVVARRKAGQLILADATVDGVAAQIVIDTGSGTSIGNRALQRALRQRGRLIQTTLVSVTGQETVADLGVADKLVVHGMSISNVVIAFADSPAFARLGLARRPTLLLGMRELRLFGRVAIDFKARRVLFDAPERLEAKL